MRAVTINLPEPLNAQMEQLARENGLTLSDFLVEVSKDIIMQEEARKQFYERAGRGRGRAAEALALLRRD
ncbi:hypothetical protein HNR26_002629 [Rhizobium rosettiformans]|uniref:Toxin-antitoxin system HicB family antitoxin n=2 Tax=Rhizobium rosettiformans TaxID=1368430 RepID=A0A4S8PYS0_9HYPH|nr:hypothetical protein [Rhizobium rosettiformans]MBB5276560.1 hypothetical protein [Rhizobium rosettiformans]THV35831.1 hypothetical protein FAA86_10855 [Rhizobium rosettiformans W3]